ncbi:transposase domain-containing protein [Streptosporangium sp. CA-135522]|uniref:transposase domain-containing protein n=1 Tax=Streptosporangium sp. CA-135522 TaxID=3240072 RepID=UPI003D92C074
MLEVRPARTQTRSGTGASAACSTRRSPRCPAASPCRSESTPGSPAARPAASRRALPRCRCFACGSASVRRVSLVNLDVVRRENQAFAYNVVRTLSGKVTQVKTPPDDVRLADQLSVGYLTSIFPMSLLDEVIEVSGCAERRRRALPARLTMYYVLALCLFSDKNYDQVMRLLLNGLAWRSRWAHTWEAPSVSAISRARARLGAEPLRVLFCRASGPAPETRPAASRLAGLRLVTMDGATLFVPETRDNSAFGYPDETARFPCVRVVAVAENGTHALIDATFGDSAVERHTLARRLLRCLESDMLLLARFGPQGLGLWRQAAETGTHLLWGITGAGAFPMGRGFADGSYLTRVTGLGDAPLRVIPLPGAEWLITTLTDPNQATAAELAARYADRWVMDSALAWLYPGRRGAAAMLRSRSPEMVAQEIWALLCIYQAVRALACQAAGDTGSSWTFV